MTHVYQARAGTTFSGGRVVRPREVAQVILTQEELDELTQRKFNMRDIRAARSLKAEIRTQGQERWEELLQEGWS